MSQSPKFLFRFRRSRFVSLLCLSSLTLQYLPALTFAQQGTPQPPAPQQAPQQQPQQGQQPGQQNQPGTNGQTQQNQVPKASDAISKTREDLAKTANKVGALRALTIDSVGPK